MQIVGAGSVGMVLVMIVGHGGGAKVGHGRQSGKQLDTALVMRLASFSRHAARDDANLPSVGLAAVIDSIPAHGPGAAVVLLTARRVGHGWRLGGNWSTGWCCLCARRSSRLESRVAYIIAPEPRVSDACRSCVEASPASLRRQTYPPYFTPHVLMASTQIVLGSQPLS